MKLFDFLTARKTHLRVAALTVVLTIHSTSSHAQLSGTKAIGSGGDYATFTAAVTALTSQGVSGAVTFNILTGIYNEQIEIGSIAGGSGDNTITFQSQSGNAADVTLTFTPNDTNNFVVRLVQADNVTFQNMTLDASSGTEYGTVVKLDGDADNNRFLNNVIMGVSTTSNSENLILMYADDDSSDNTTITGNTLINGSRGVALVGTNPDLFSSGTQVADNVFTNQATKGISLFYHNGAHVNGNTISSTSLNVSVGIEVTRCDSALEILGNKITIPNSGYGINLYACNGSAASPGVVANNFITSLHGNSTGMWVSNCTYEDVYYNSVNITNESFEGQALWVDGTALNVNIVNNIFANEGGGYCFTAYPPATGEIAISNYNNLYTTGGRIAYWEGSDIVDLAAFRSVSGNETNSISADPLFYSSTNLHLYATVMDSTGTPLAAVTTDIDGELRDLNRPDIGADEFSIVRLSLNQAWNMVSVPVVVANFQSMSLFPGATTNVFAYLSGSYATQDTLANKLGYWVKYGGTLMVSMTGGPITSDTFDVALGWNLIGSISTPVLASSVVSIPGGLVTSPFFKYELSYTSADTIQPGRAYWVKTTGAGTLVLSSSATAPSLGRIKIMPVDEPPPPPPPDGLSSERHGELPLSFAMEQNHPNPFNPSTVINYSLPEPVHVTLKVFDVLGKELVTLVDEDQTPGFKSVRLDASGLTSGIYFYKLQAGHFGAVKKLVFMK
ncbi:MAG TPA: T9SS type A sorting domain-containing protein [Saprospiraceae bacterium]|nr:T9SS type A sorting domain-containing protein [Saprospiraceae bacterium]